MRWSYPDDNGNGLVRAVMATILAEEWAAENPDLV